MLGPPKIFSVIPFSTACLAQVSSYFIVSYCNQPRLFSTQKFEVAHLVLHETDEVLKSTPVLSSIWLENIVLKLCSF